MKTSYGKLLLTTVALASIAGCAAAPQTARNGNGTSPRTVTDTWATETPRPNVDVRQDAYGNNRDANGKTLITGSLIPQDAQVHGNSADTATPTRIYGQGDLRRHGGGLSAGDSLSRIDPAISGGL